MAIMAKSSGDGQSFQPAPAGMHQAVCVDVVDLGVLKTTWQGVEKSRHKINVAWQIAEAREDGKPFLVFKRYTLSLHEKSGLRKDLESWRGKPFTRDEEMGFDVEAVLGVNCLLNIVHRPVGEKVHANVQNVNPLMKGMAPIQARDYVRKCERTPETESQAQPHDDQEPPPLTDDDIPF